MRRARRLPIPIAATIALVLGLGLLAATASAETETKTVKADVVFQYGNDPADPGNCSALVFVQWPDVPGTTGGTAFYLRQGKEASEGISLPYTDTVQWVIPYTVTPGYHWVNVSKSWRDGPGVNDCSAASGRQRAIIGTEARVELTVTVPKARSKACRVAKAASGVTRVKIKTLRAKLAKTTDKEDRAKLSKAITKTTAKHKVNLARVTTAC